MRKIVYFEDSYVYTVCAMYIELDLHFYFEPIKTTSGGEGGGKKKITGAELWHHVG